jgi:hypothetical protein
MSRHPQRGPNAPARGTAQHPVSRAAVSMVTAISSPTLGWGPGRESNPVSSLSQNDAAIQTQGAVQRTVAQGQMGIGILDTVRICSRAKGSSGPFCALPTT